MTDLPKTTRAWEVTNLVSGVPTTTGDNPTFTLKTYDLPQLGDEQVLVKTLYFSNDPAGRIWIQAGIPEGRKYLKLSTGEVMPSYALAEVLASTSEKIKKGDLVRSWFGWREYGVFDVNDGIEVVRPPPGLDVTHYLGALGNTGKTAYYGLLEVAGAKGGETIVVSGAAGATGSIAIQIAKKLIPSKSVIGIAGSDEKCRWVESLGADKCLNYKPPKTEATKDGVDVYFDNVGGEILNLILGLMNLEGRLAACGAISGYNSDGKPYNNMTNWMNVILMRLRVQGFIQSDYNAEGSAKAQKVLQDGIVDGTIKVEGGETIVEAKVEDIPSTWLRLFEGQNTGKLVTKLI